MERAMKKEIGTRVGAICGKSDDGSQVLFFGYGIYQGEEIPGPEVLGPMGIKLHDLEIRNPKILLDSGEIVWGCECWWASEATIRESLEAWGSEGIIAKPITPSEYREQCQQASLNKGNPSSPTPANPD
jgi:hypothetical protein